MIEERKLQKAKIDLMRNPKFALLSGLLMVGTSSVSDAVPTACTNGRDEWYGREFIKSLSEKELRFVVAHETMHKMYRHMTTWTKLVKEDAGIANVAMDHVGNLMLRELDPYEEVIAMPVYKDGPKKGQPMGCADVRFKGMNTKQVFDILKQEQEDDGHGDEPGDERGRHPSDQPGGAGDDDGNQPDDKGKPKGKRGNGTPDKGQGSQPHDGGFDQHDHEGAGQLSEKEKQELERDVGDAIRQGVVAASRFKGNGSGNALLAVQDLLRPKVDWRQVLREYVKATCYGKDMSSWRRLNRRFIGQDLYLPTTISERVHNIVLAIDTSGSIGTKELTEVLSEVQGIAEEVKPECVHVLYWDTRIVSHEEYNEGAVSTLVTSTKPTGGGGTSPSCIPTYLSDKQITPDCVIVFTDGYVGDDWGNGWTAPLLWLINGNREAVAAHGQTIHMENV